MKKLILTIFLLLFSLPVIAKTVPVNFAKNDFPVQKVFAPNENTIILLSCYNFTEKVKENCDKTMVDMAKKWKVATSPSPQIIVQNTAGFYRKFIIVDVGGLTSKDSYPAFPENTIFYTYKDGRRILGMLKIDDQKTLMAELERLIH